MAQDGEEGGDEDILVSSIVRRLQSSLVEGHAEHADEIKQLLLMLACEPGTHRRAKLLVREVRQGRGLRSNMGPELLEKLSDVLKDEIRELTKVEKEQEERKTGRWQNLFFATAGSTMIGLIGLVTATAVPISAPMALVLAPATAIAFVGRRRAHDRAELARITGEGLQIIVDEIDKKPD